MAAPPNLLVVIVDDMSAHQLGCYGSAFYETPQIDQLAREGVRFSNAYSASPVCSPSRAGLYTGQHPARLHLTNYIPGTEPANPRLLTPPWRGHLPVEVVTLGDALKAAGYDTGHFGKWHLAPDYHYRPGRVMDPESQGFDTTVVTRKPPATADPEGDPHHIDRLTDCALQFMSRPRGGRPFLCVLAHNALHRPEIAPRALVGKYAAKPRAEQDHNRPVLAAMVDRIDSSMGRLLEHLRTNGLEQDTVVVFTSDHGAFGRSADRKPLRGSKADLYEGGLRVPLLARWPGQFPSGERHVPALGTDLFPTLLEIASCAIPAGLDGVSFRGQLTTPSDAGTDRSLYWHFPHYHHLGIGPCGAIRSGRWKMIEWFERTLGGQEGAPRELYDIEDDPGEHRDLSAENPARCERLAQELAEWRRSIGAQEMKPNPDFDRAAPGQTAAPPPGDPGNPYSE